MTWHSSFQSQPATVPLSWLDDNFAFLYAYPTITVLTLTATTDYTLTQPTGSMTERAFVTGTAARNFNPSGTFTNGFMLELINTGNYPITFDSTGINIVVPAGQTGVFYTDATSWYYIQATDYYPSPTAADHGAAGTRTIASILSAIGTTKKANIVLEHVGSGTNTDYVIGQNVNWSTYTNITWIIKPGARFSRTTYTMTFPTGTILDAGHYQIFAGAGTVSGLGYAETIWYGTVGDGTTDDRAAMQRAFASIVDGGKVHVNQGSYKIVNATGTGATDVDKRANAVASGTLYPLTISADNATLEIAGNLTATSYLGDLIRIEGDNVKVIGVGGSVTGNGSYYDYNSSTETLQWKMALIKVIGDNVEVSGMRVINPSTLGICAIGCDGFNAHHNIIEGGNTVHGAGTYLMGIATDRFTGGVSSYNATISNNYFKPDAGGGLCYTNIYNVAHHSAIEGNTGEDVQEHMIYNYGQNTSMSGNTSRSSSGNMGAAHIQSFARGCSFTGNNLSGGHSGIQTAAATGGLITGNTINDVLGYGIIVSSYQTSKTLIENISITGNTITLDQTKPLAARGSGIHFRIPYGDARNIIITDNNITGGGYSGSAPLAGLVVAAGTGFKIYDAIVANNTVFDPFRYGTYFINLKHSTVDNNKVIYSTEVLSLDVAPATAWGSGDVITGESSSVTAHVVAASSNPLIYYIMDRSGQFTPGEILSNGTYTANQGANYPQYAGMTETMTLDVAPGGAGWAVGDTITGESSGAYVTVERVASTTSYSITNRHGKFTAGEVLTNGTATADQGAGYPLITTGNTLAMKLVNCTDMTINGNNIRWEPLPVSLVTGIALDATCDRTSFDGNKIYGSNVVPYSLNGTVYGKSKAFTVGNIDANTTVEKPMWFAEGTNGIQVVNHKLVNMANIASDDTDYAHLYITNRLNTTTGHFQQFSAGGGTTGAQLRVGDTITGATSTNTAVIHNIAIDSGSWANGTAAGAIFVTSVTGGTFDAGGEDCNTSKYNAIIHLDGALATPVRQYYVLTESTPMSTLVPLSMTPLSAWSRLIYKTGDLLTFEHLYSGAGKETTEMMLNTTYLDY